MSRDSSSIPAGFTVRRAGGADAAALHELAALTFPLACPPTLAAEDIADFIGRHLSTVMFERYLADRERALFVAETASGIIGYTMLVMGEPADPDVASAITARPTAELSKVYTHPDHHGTGVALALLSDTVDEAARRGASGVWLGVNQRNDRANRFYEKHGFARVGTKRFQVGSRWEHDFVRERLLG